MQNENQNGIETKVFCGIDIGFTGAFCFITFIPKTGHLVDVSFADMPLTNDKNGRSLVDAAQAHALIVDAAPHHVTYEQVGAMPRQGLASTFRFGQGYGVIQAVLAISGAAFESVSPQSWKKVCRVNGEKDFARTQAIQRYPMTAPHLKLKKHSGRADAFWIAMCSIIKNK